LGLNSSRYTAEVGREINVKSLRCSAVCVAAMNSKLCIGKDRRAFARKKSLQRYICVQVCGLWQFTSQALIDCSCFQRCLLIIIPPYTSDAATFITHGLHASRLSGCLLSHCIGLRVLQESGRNRSAEKSALLKMVPISTCSLTSNVAPYRRTWTSSAPLPRGGCTVGNLHQNWSRSLFQ